MTNERPIDRRKIIFAAFAAVPVAALPGPARASIADPAVLATLDGLKESHRCMEAADALLGADMVKFAAWQRLNPCPRSKRGTRRWTKVSRKVLGELTGDSLDTLREAQDRFREAGKAVVASMEGRP